MNVENTILKYIGELNCDICGKDVIDDMVGVTCCNKIYHRSCIMNINNLDCPNCQKMYIIQEDKPLLRLLLSRMKNSLSVLDLYIRIYKQNPSDLYLIDNALFKNQTSSQYCSNFTGYFDYSLFNDDFNINDLDEKWDEFSYGLLTGYDWNYTYWTGKALYDIIHYGFSSLEHIVLGIFNSDYRKVRQQLDCLISCIEKNINDKCFINIEEGLVILNIRGITKKICVHIEYLDKPFIYIFGKIQKYIPSYGSLYKKGTVMLTLKSMLRKYQDTNVYNLQSLSKPLGYDVDAKLYSKKINSCVISRKILLDKIYCPYKFYVRAGKDMNDIKHEILKQIIFSSNLKNTIDIVHETVNDNENMTFHLVNDYETINFSDNIITAKKVIDFVLKRLYRQHIMLLRPL